MIIVPAFCAQSYAYNSRVEEKVGSYLSSITGLQVKDFSTGVRPQYDFLIGDDVHGFVQVELKTTGSKYIPVETHKDEKRTVEGGLLTSTAPIVITLSQGTRSGYKGDVGKLRAFSRKSLLTQAGKTGLGKFYSAANPSEGSYSYSFSPSHDSYHVWLGDIPVVYQKVGMSDDHYVVGYDLDSIFDDDQLRRLELLEMINKFRGVDE